MALLFADAVNFSKLSERQVPLFYRDFLGRIAELLNTRYRRTSVTRDTWGDALYLAFRSIRDAGNFALDLRDVIRDTDWPRHGLPPELSIRIALHAGPVFLEVDPVTKRRNWRGTHTSRAARLEPKTTPGEVYASEAFAALATLERITDFRCVYVKQLDWAKHYGTFPTYVLRR